MQLKETAELKTIKRSKAIWELFKIQGKNWRYYSGTINNTIHSLNWKLNKELDMWGDPTGVDLDNNGRVAENLASASVPKAGYLMGQLTELKRLWFGRYT